MNNRQEKTTIGAISPPNPMFEANFIKKQKKAISVVIMAFIGSIAHEMFLTTCFRAAQNLTSSKYDSSFD